DKRRSNTGSPCHQEGLSQHKNQEVDYQKGCDDALQDIDLQRFPPEVGGLRVQMAAQFEALDVRVIGDQGDEPEPSHLPPERQTQSKPAIPVAADLEDD